MIKSICAALAVCAAFVEAGEFKLYCKFDSADSQLRNRYKETLLTIGESNAPYATLSAWSPGRSIRLKFVLNAAGIGFAPVDGRELGFGVSGFNAVSTPDLYCAFRLAVPAGCTAQFRVGAYSKTLRGNRYRTVQIKPGEVRFVRIKLHGTGFLEPGDPVRSVGVSDFGSGRRSWQVDKFAVWSGTPPPPPPVAELRAAVHGDDVKLSWQTVKAALPVAGYRIHRGSVANFIPTEKNLLARTETASFTDRTPMRLNGFYRVLPEDVSGQTGSSGHAVTAP